MKHIECDSLKEAQAILDQIRGEGHDSWATLTEHAETGKAIILVPGNANYAKFGKKIMEKEDLITHGYHKDPKKDLTPDLLMDLMNQITELKLRVTALEKK
jgi:hypothetical protein